MTYSPAALKLFLGGHMVAALLKDYVPYMHAACLDFAVGILIAVLLWRYVYKEMPSFGVMFGGGALALLPDIDTLPGIFGLMEHPEDHHRLLTHYPLIMLPLGGFIGLYVGAWFGNAYRGLTLALLCITWHFIHDTPGRIAWLMPFSDEYWVVPIWPYEGSTIAEMWGRPTIIAQTELGLAAAAFVVAGFLHRHWFYRSMGVALPACVWGVAFLSWNYLPALGAATATAAP